MNSKLATRLSFAIALVALSFTSPLNAGQIQGVDSSYCNSCDCEPNWLGLRGFGRCMVGHTVSDGLGGTFRAYGYPRLNCGRHLDCGPCNAGASRVVPGAYGGYPSDCPPSGNVNGRLRTMTWSK